MKTRNKVLRTILSLAAAITVFALWGSVDALAKNSYQLDSKNGIVYESAVRTSVRYRGYAYGSESTNKSENSNYKDPLYFYNGYDISIFTKSDKTSVTVKSDSSNLLAKVVYSQKYTGEDFFNVYNATSWYDAKKGTYAYHENLKDEKYMAKFGIQTYAKKEGNYTLTVTIKKGKKKVSKKIRVYAREFNGAFASVKYGNTELGSFDSITTKAGSGKFKVKMNRDYKLLELQIGTYVGSSVDYNKEESYDSDDVIKWSKLKNGSKINLSTATKYTTERGRLSGDYQYSNKTDYDFLYPVTPIRVVYKDKLTGETYASVAYLTYINK